MSKILIVDDDESIADLLQLKFKNHGFKAYTSNNGEDALKQAKRIKPDVVLLDYFMPLKSGGSFILELRSKKWGADIPVIMMTNSIDIADLRDQYGAVVSEVISKVDQTPEEIFFLVKALLSINEPPEDYEVLCARRLVSEL